MNFALSAVHVMFVLLELCVFTVDCVQNFWTADDELCTVGAVHLYC